MYSSTTGELVKLVKLGLVVNSTQYAMSVHFLKQYTTGNDLPPPALPFNHCQPFNPVSQKQDGRLGLGVF